MNRQKHWYDYFWIWTLLYFILGFYNILFAWLGLIDFFVPILISLFGGGKLFCNYACGRGQLLNLLGKDAKCSLRKQTPYFLASKWFRYFFLGFFMMMFGLMLWNTYLVAAGQESLRAMLKLLWVFDVPWHWAVVNNNVPDWVIQFSLGFYSVMLTSTIIGLVVMWLYKPRTWCAFCPMGTMTQLLAKLRA